MLSRSRTWSFGVQRLHLRAQSDIEMYREKRRCQIVIKTLGKKTSSFGYARQRIFDLIASLC
jgi:hypothetical protein